LSYLLATDYDGTLRQGNGISKETVEAINAFREKGNIFGIVSGRNFVNGYLVFKKENLFPFDFIISHNGAAAFDVDGNNYFTVYVDGGIRWGNSTLAKELILKCLSLSDELCILAFERSSMLFIRELPNGGIINNTVYSPLSDLDGVDKFVSAGVVCTNEQHACEVIRILQKSFGKYINPIQNGRCIDITPCGVDKATGVRKLAEILGIHHDNIWTAGDNYNDLPTLTQFHGCAMSGGVEEVKCQAEFVCDNVAQVIHLMINEGDT